MTTANNNYTIDKKDTRIFYILMFTILAGFLIATFAVPSERDEESLPENIIYKGTFIWEKSDGTEEEITVPGNYDLPAKETMVITTQLPSDYDASNLAIRSSLQDVRFYIDGMLRCEYDTSSTRIFGKNSASRYIFCPTSSEDAGKEVRIELTTNTKHYSGIVNTVYCGDKIDIWECIFTEYGAATIIALFFLFAGIVTVIFSIALGIVYKTKFDMEYLGWCIVMGSVWMLGESNFRQLLVPNASALASLCFVMIMLCPLPILFYADSIQHGRHRKLYQYIERIALVNLFVCSFLHFTGIADYIETLPVGQIILVLTFVTIFMTFAVDMRKAPSKEEHLVIFGLLVSMISILIETISVYFVVSISGIFIGIGMLILLFVNILRTMKHVHSLENKRQEEEMRRRRQQMEQISLQIIQTLSLAIESKDEYTRGHSHRVAEYSAILAKELDWSQAEILNLKHAAYLHDIGKFSIPDIILNKPTKLTEEEYTIIKNHTIIGAEMLKNITLIDHVVEVARNHHERYDGHGYPDGLKGRAIPLHARIVALADSYDAMRSKRIYRNALPQQTIYEELKQNRGTQFDPELTDIFLRLLDENRMVISNDTPNIDAMQANPEVENEIGKLISDVMTTIKSQEDSDNFDLLTGLPVRNIGEKMTAQFMQEHGGCLAFMDMDNLKQINDIYGHKAGDRALKSLGNLLADYAQNAAVCRLGGDEFLLFMPNVTHESMTRLMEEIFEKFRILKADDIEIRSASISAGLCMCEKGASFEDCYQKADKALYYVKQNGKENFFFYQQLEQEHLTDTATVRDLSLVAKALRESGNYTGALDLDYRDFAKIYEYMNSLGARYRHHCYLVMVTMNTQPNSTMYIEHIEQALECMEQAIRKKIRKVDIYTRYSSLQYLIILSESNEDQIPKIMNRIFIQYYKLYNKHDFTPAYEYIPMVPNEISGEQK